MMIVQFQKLVFCYEIIFMSLTFKPVVFLIFCNLITLLAMFEKINFMFLLKRSIKIFSNHLYRRLKVESVSFKVHNDSKRF